MLLFPLFSCFCNLLGKAIADHKESIATLTEELAALADGITALDKQVAEATEERKEEHEAYQQAKKDDEAAVKLLEEAKKAFTSYYKKNDVKMGPIQGSVKGLLLSQGEPAFERSADDAPDATFSKKGKNKLAGKDIVSLFQYIIEGLNDELANEKEAEAKSQGEYQEERATAEKLVSDLEEKVVTLEESNTSVTTFSSRSDTSFSAVALSS
jgi:peptidoglycan hydrolase CwlO-like protein